MYLKKIEFFFELKVGGSFNILNIKLAENQIPTVSILNMDILPINVLKMIYSYLDMAICRDCDNPCINFCCICLSNICLNHYHVNGCCMRSRMYYCRQCHEEAEGALTGNILYVCERCGTFCHPCCDNGTYLCNPCRYEEIHQYEIEDYHRNMEDSDY